MTQLNIKYRPECVVVDLTAVCHQRKIDATRRRISSSAEQVTRHLDRQRLASPPNLLRRTYLQNLKDRATALVVEAQVETRLSTLKLIAARANQVVQSASQATIP